MVIREDLKREEQSPSSPGEQGRSPAWQGQTRLPAEGLQKCPYLAGRPPCGSHHLFPSGTNVCWADPGTEKPYRPISRDTQATYCFGGSDGQDACDRYRQAVEAARPLPHFQRARTAAPSGPEWVLPPCRPKSRSALLLKHAAWLVPLGLMLLLLALLLRAS